MLSDWIASHGISLYLFGYLIHTRSIFTTCAEAKHFLFPFLAHALGTFAGAFLAAIIAASHKMEFALGIGVFFLAGGIANVFVLPSPTWFTILDLMGAYIPVAYFAGKLVVKKQ